jgi:hypothetical protein
VHRTVGVPAGTPIQHSGWAVALSPEHTAEAEQTAEVRLNGPDVTSQLLGLYGWQTQSAVRAPQGTAYGPWALVPELTGTVGEPGAGTVFVALASLTGEPDPSPLAGLATAEANGRAVTIRWADGARTVIDFGSDGHGPSVTEGEPS